MVDRRARQHGHQGAGNAMPGAIHDADQEVLAINFDENGVVHVPQTFGGIVSYDEDGLTGDVSGLELQAIFPFRVLWDPLEGLGMIATATFLDGELSDGTRVNVTDHGSLTNIRAQATQLGAYLHKPVWDAIG